MEVVPQVECSAQDMVAKEFEEINTADSSVSRKGGDTEVPGEKR